MDGCESRPCAVQLGSGKFLSMVYVVNYVAFLSFAGGDLETWTPQIGVQDVIEFRDSPHRLPPAVASKLYTFPETGMGYVRFVIRFGDGSQYQCALGSFRDFVAYPHGKGPSDVEDVSMFPSSAEADALPSLGAFPEDPHFCFYSGDVGEPSRSFAL